jgi:hypothetical protein
MFHIPYVSEPTSLDSESSDHLPRLARGFFFDRLEPRGRTPCI